MTRGRLGERGFTLIEVMVAMLVFMIAVLGLVALQKASVTAAYKGRMHTAAVNNGDYVMTWIRNEVNAWPLGEEDPSAQDFPILAMGLTNEGRWNLLPDGEEAADVGFRLDPFLGHSKRSFYTGENVDTPPYCVHYMLRALGTGREVVRARVRIVWPKWKQYKIDGDEPGVWNECDWTNYDDPSTVEDRLRYSEVVELTSIFTREYTAGIVE